jgi:hypothetical protein
MQIKLFLFFKKKNLMYNMNLKNNRYALKYIAISYDIKY